MSDRLDYLRLFDATPTPYLILNAELRIVAVNDAYLNATMTRREDILGRGMFEVFPDDPRDPDATGVRNLSESFESALRSGEPDVMAIQKYDIRSPDGSFEERYWSPINTPLLDEDGNVELIIHRVTDVTQFVKTTGHHEPQQTAETRRREQEMETELFNRARELDRLNRSLRHANDELAATTARLRAEQDAKDRFLATLSHELRNPLAAIRGALDVLDDPVAARATEGREMLAVVERQVQALTRMTDDLLEMTRAQVGKLQLDTTELDLGALAQAAVQAARTGSARAAQTITTTLDGETWVNGDPVRLSQAIGNVLGNAIKFTGQDGHIEVHVRGDQHVVALEVVDDGQGFDPAMSEELFEPFAQQDRSLARTTAGLGLGLPIARTIIELHGGRIAAHSGGPGQGADFTIELPAIQPGAHPAPSADERQERSVPGHQCVLVIEDHDDVATAYLTLLQQLGLRTNYARTGAAGIELATRTRPNVILCDIGLPDIDGYEVAQRLRATPHTAHIPLIAISGYGHAEDRTRSQQAGFSQHLVKPLSSQSLARALIDTAQPET